MEYPAQDKTGGEPSRRRLLVHQFDPARPSPGGIDTCIRGLCRYAPDTEHLVIVGVDAVGDRSRLGRWEQHRFEQRTISFMPVATLDPNNQRRKVPHSVRLLIGVWRYRKRLPNTEVVQGHRADVSAALLLLRRPLAYFVHTQRQGLTGATSDSFWRRAARIHEAVEKFVVQRARDVVVFNPSYADELRRWNRRARFSPTWYDPALIRPSQPRASKTICWVGRLETPKDPLLAISAFSKLLANDPANQWELKIAGAGSLSPEVAEAVHKLSRDSASRIQILGRQSPQQVADLMATSGLFLMTSHPGYEGYPRVLVEAMASGLIPVVTRGSDTGSLVSENNGIVTGRDAGEIAKALAEAETFDRSSARRTAEQLSAPVIVGALFEKTGA